MNLKDALRLSVGMALGVSLASAGTITYVCGPGVAAATCNFLNTTVAGMYSSAFTNASATIYVKYGTTGLAQSQTAFNTVSYSAYLAALTANPNKNGLQTLALVALNAFDSPVYGGDTVSITASLAAALGLTGPGLGFGVPAGSSTPCTLGSPDCYDGVVTVTNDPSAPLYYDNLGGPEPADAYDFYATIEHETNEILGTSSCIGTAGKQPRTRATLRPRQASLADDPASLTDGCDGFGPGTPSAVDLFRYSAAGSLVLDSSLSTTPGAYFSYNGGSTNGASGKAGPKVYNTLVNGEDYADFLSSSPDCGTNQVVQDAEGCPGEDAGLSILNDGRGEINILNAVGYNVPVANSNSSVYISDNRNNRIRLLNASTSDITTLAGNGVAGFTGDGAAATSAELHAQFGVALDSSGNLYIADAVNNRIRMVNHSSGIITTVAGNGSPSYSGDTGLATNAGLNNPTAVAVDSLGNLYIADQRNNRIRRVTSGVITTVAGNGTTGNGGDTGPATSAQLYYPGGVAVDGSGNLYIADSDNQRIRKVNAAGTITTIAGNGNAGYNCNNGVATSAGLHNPGGVAVDGSGDLYIADYGNQCVRKVSAGNITTVAGNGLASFSGDGGPATSAALNYPTGVAVDSSGNLYIADYVNNRVREVRSGIITTIAGNGAAGFTGDGGPATSAELFNPTGVAVTPPPAPLVGP